MRRSRYAPAAGLLLLATIAAAAAPTKGTISREGVSAEIRHVYLFRGPDPDGDESKTIRRLVFSPTDIGARLKACEDMNCTTKHLFEPAAKGLVVDLIPDDWARYTAQLPGFGMGGSFDPEPALALTKDEPKHVAGTLRLDLAESAGPVGEIVFDAALTREFSRAR